MTTPIDLSQLPAPAVVEDLDYEAILSDRKARLIDLHPEDEQAAIAELLEIPSEPIVKLLEENAYREMQWRRRVNEAAQAVMLARSRGTDLDQVVANYNIERLVIDAGDPTAQPPVSPTMESDADLRRRAQQAFEGLSVAGPRAAYSYHALSAAGGVADATAISPSPCDVLVTVLARDGDGTAPQDLLDAVESALSAEDVRPVGDRLTVQSASIVPYSVAATLYLYPGPEAEPIQSAATERLSAYVSAQRRLGRDIRRSAIFAALHVEGVQRVELTEPATDVVLDETEAAHCAALAVTVGGTDE